MMMPGVIAMESINNCSFIRPGIVQGIYPEKDHKDYGLIDNIVNSTVKLFSSDALFVRNARRVFVNKVKKLEQKFISMDEKEIAFFAQSLRNKLQCQGIQQNLAIEAFALVKEVSFRTIGMRHYDVQVIGGWVMLNGMITEMDTGEGKTLTATFPACTAALAGVPVHIVTVNDYLVQRDMELMAPIYHFLGLSVGAITEQMDSEQRQKAYACDITYCTNKQLAFDYLRDRLVLKTKVNKTQLRIEKLDKKNTQVNRLHLRGLCYAIIDEADSVLIDESRTPLILSKEGKEMGMQKIVTEALACCENLLEHEHFQIDYKNRVIEFSENGKEKIRELVADYTGVWAGYERSIELITQALTAKYLFVRDQHYLVQDDKIQIVDEYTGRVMADRSWEYGLHQMLEAKEGCKITAQKETLAKISYQQFFRRYFLLAGMTGTAKEVGSELWSVYHLDPLKVPTHHPDKKKRFPTKIFKTAKLKWAGLVQHVTDIHQQGRPILIGTRSVEFSEHISQLLDENGLDHEVLNARQDAHEADIIKKAGIKGQITVATNMAGRGTDIKLAETVAEIGGLHVIATECHEARRIDRQLFGRCGRQGDPGSYVMFVSFEDELVLKFCPHYLQSSFNNFNRYNNFIFNFLIEYFVFRKSQKIAEKKFERDRRNLLKIDARLKSLLAFSGNID